MRKIFVVAAIIFSSQLHAQNHPAGTDSSAIAGLGDSPTLNTTLDRVVVTTNKYPKKQSQTGKVVTVIDRSTLEQLGGHSLGEVLNTVAGVTINGANNNPGTNQRISIRGSSDGNVLLLIDGIPVNDPSVISNYFDLNFINTANIERIEVLKGGHSTLYGSDAVSGVINIITKKGVNKKAAPYASLSFGSYHTFNGTAGVRGQTRTINYHVFTTAVSSKGFSSAYDSTSNHGFDRDGYRQNILRAELGLKLSSNLKWNFYGNYSRYKAGIDAAAFTDDKDFIARNKNWQAGSGMYWRQKKGGLHLNYQFNYLNRFYLDDSADRASFAYYSKSTYIGRTQFAEAYENYRWDHLELLAGLDYRHYNTQQVYNSVSIFGPFDTELNDSMARMWQASGYASAVYSQQALNIELGGRFNHHNVYGNNVTYTFNPSYLFAQKLKLFVNLSSAFKTPSLFQLFDAFSGNQHLEPEKSTVFEGGAELYPAARLRLRALGFYRKTKNAIQYIITDPITFEGHYYNTNEQKNSGMEAELDYEGEQWNIYSNYTFTKGKVSSAYAESGEALAKDTTYNNLYRVPTHAFNATVSYRFNKKVSVTTVLKYLDKRLEPVYAAAPQELAAYVTIDLAALYRFGKNIQAFADLKNMTNKRYFDILGYNSRRFNLTAGINMNF